MKNRFYVNISGLKNGDEMNIDDERDFIMPPKLDFDENRFFVKSNGSIRKADKCFFLRLRCETDIQMPCARCLAPVRKTVVFDVDERFLEGYDDESDEDDAFYIKDSVAVLDEAVYVNLLSAMPIRLLCKDDCKGLCMYCGINLNEFSCDCADSVSDSKFSDVRHFFDK